MTLRRSSLMAVSGFVLFVGGAAAWWLVSPLFLSRTVHEEFPLTRSAVVPATMTRSEAEHVMAGVAKIDREISETMPRAMATARAVRTGAFRDGDSFHKGSGRVTLYRLPHGTHLLRFEDFKVTNGPALYVLLARHPDPRERAHVKDPGFVELGPLKGNIGSQNYVIPAGVDLAAHRSVVIYCKPFQVVFSVAPLTDGG
jgi:hypothetical protein